MIHRVRVNGSAEVLQEIDRVMEYPLRETTDDGNRCMLNLWSNGVQFISVEFARCRAK